MKFRTETFKDVAELVLDNERYKVYDLKLEHLTVSITELHPGKETRGHSHENVEEVYLCLEGNGEIEVSLPAGGGQEKMPFGKGDVVTIPLGAFHRVYNKSKKDLKFMAIFEKYER